MVRNISKSGDLRRARWVSSINGDSSQLGRLQAHLQIFYSSSERDPYQAMLDKQDDDYFQKDNPAKAVIDLFCALAPSQILEIGCSHGGAYRALRTRAFRGEYVGCDVSQSVIERDRTRHPETTWTTSSAYQLPFRDDSFDACFSIYVLEHLVYPEEALDEMLRVTKEGGHAILLFPDFLESGRLASQQAGFGFGTTKEKLKQGKLLDALVTFYDNRVRFPKMLKGLKRRIGDFTVQLQPACLYYPNMARPDYDAVYIASRAEVVNWAVRQGHGFYLPKGVQGLFKDHAFVAIRKDSKLS